VLVKELQSLGLAVEAETDSGEIVRFGKEDEKRGRRWTGSDFIGLSRR
jgi:DNA-directed RNA polymerase subunit beta